MKIIKANKNYLNLIAPLFDAYRVFYKQDSDILEAEKFISERLENSDSIILLIMNKEENEAFGFAQIYPSFTSIGMKKIFILNDIYVKEEYRKTGLARMLLEEVNKITKENKISKITLRTAHSNIAAQRLYESLGYEKEKEFMNYNLVV